MKEKPEFGFRKACCCGSVHLMAASRALPSLSHVRKLCRNTSPSGPSPLMLKGPMAAECLLFL